MNLLLAAIIIFIFNIPFGYWRAKTRKFSMQWFLSIHLPVPFVVGLRFLANLGFKPHTFIVTIGAFFAGQYIGLKLSKARNPVM